MTLHPLPDVRETVIVVGTSVRKPLAILGPHLATLAWQELPPRTRLHFIYVPDFTAAQEDAREHLFKWVNARDGELLAGASAPSDVPDFDDAHADSHQWTHTAMARVGYNKNLILQRARELQADYLFYCDADLLLDRTTIASLLACEKPITTAVYWTHWSRSGVETRQIHAAPQVWLQHPYQLSGRGLEEGEFRQKLIDRELTRVWGFGACTLLTRRVIESGVSFAYLADVPHGPEAGLMAGEDRHFCINAERRHIDAWADPWPDIYHVYHPLDVERIPEMLARLGETHPQRATLGDSIAIRLRPLEPMPVGGGRFAPLPTVLTRGRLGALALAPELEEACHHLARGERQVIKVHCPVHHEIPQLRGRMRLIELTVIDAKGYAFAPVIEDELYVGPHSGAWMDQTTLTDPQHESIRAIGGAESLTPSSPTTPTGTAV